MTPLMERSIEGSLFDDGASSMLTEATAGGPPAFGYRTSPSSDYERLPIAPSDGPSTLAPLDSSHEALGRSEAELDAMEEYLDTSEAMTDSGMSYGEAALPNGSSLPALLPSPALMRPHRFPPLAAPSRSADNSSGIASRASQSSSGEPSVTGSPPSHSALSSVSSGGGGGGGGGFGAARMGRQLMAQLLHSFRRKAKPVAAVASSSVPTSARHRTASDSSSIL